MKYKFVPSTPEFDWKMKGVEFELVQYNGQFYMDGGQFSIPIDSDGISLSKHAGRQGVFNPIEGKKK